MMKFNFREPKSIAFDELRKMDVALNAILFCNLSGRTSPFWEYTEKAYREYASYLYSKHPEKQPFARCYPYEGLRKNLSQYEHINTETFYFLCVMACFLENRFDIPCYNSWLLFEKAFTVLSKKCTYFCQNTFLEDWKYFWWGFDASFGEKYKEISIGDYDSHTFEIFKTELLHHSFTSGSFVKVLSNKSTIGECAIYYASFEIGNLTSILQHNPESSSTRDWRTEREIANDLLNYAKNENFLTIIQYCKKCGAKILPAATRCRVCKSDLTLETSVTQQPKPKIESRRSKRAGIEISFPETLEAATMFHPF